MKKPGWFVLGCVVVVVALGVVGEQDYQEQKRQEREYCENVASGIWPDYNGNAREVCKWNRK